MLLAGWVLRKIITCSRAFLVLVIFLSQRLCQWCPKYKSIKKYKKKQLSVMVHETIFNKNLDKFIRAAYHQNTHISRRWEMQYYIKRQKDVTMVSFLHYFHKNLCDIMRAAFKKAALKMMSKMAPLDRVAILSKMYILAMVLLWCH